MRDNPAYFVDTDWTSNHVGVISPSKATPRTNLRWSFLRSDIVYVGDGVVQIGVEGVEISDASPCVAISTAAATIPTTCIGSVALIVGGFPVVTPGRDPPVVPNSPGVPMADAHGRSPYFHLDPPVRYSLLPRHVVWLGLVPLLLVLTRIEDRGFGVGVIWVRVKVIIGYLIVETEVLARGDLYF